MVPKEKIYATVLLIVLMLCGRNAYPQASEVQFEHLSVKDGLSQISVVSIFQDAQGFLWFGTRNGLNKYDGYDFQVFSESDETRYISNSHIECMAEDGKGRLWVGTRRGLNRYDNTTGRFAAYYHSGNDSTLSDDNVICMFRDFRGELWVGTLAGLDRYIAAADNFERCSFDGLPPGIAIHALTEDHEENLWIGTENGLYIYNPHTKRITPFWHQPLNNSISENKISALFCDSKGRVWVGLHQQGVCLYDADENAFIRYRKEDGLNNNTIRCFEEDADGNILVGTFDGLSRFDEQNRKFVSAYSSADNDAVLMGNFSVYDVLCDRAGTVWVGTYSGGVSYYSPYSQRFRFRDPGMQGRMLFGIVGPMVEHATGIWMGTEGGGLLFFDRNHRSYQYYRLPNASQKTFSRNIVKSLLLEGDMLWVGTTHNTVYRFDISRREFRQSVAPPWGNIHYALFRDSRQKLWIGSSGGNALGCLHPDGRFVHPVPLAGGQVFNPSNIRCFLEDSAGRMYIGTFNNGLYRYDANAQTVVHFPHQDSGRDNTAYDKITSICKTRDGDIWVSSLGGGISRLDTVSGRFDNFGQQHGLASLMVYALLEDLDGKLWLSTSSGISGFDPQTKAFTNYNKNNGIRVSEFTPGSCVVTSDNEVFFGGNDGFVSFYPRMIKTNSYIPPVFITGISVNNQALDEVPLPGKEISLNHEQSNITIEFSALNYIYPAQNRYAYKLEGFDKDWNDVGNRRTAYYTNIQPGKYTFRVKGSNNDGVWNEQGAGIQVNISQPPWNTWWAWVLYVSALTVGICLLVKNSRIKARLKNNIRIKQLEQESMEELHQTKIKLFTNFSHELRTPLTLILTPLEDILQHNGLAPALHDALRLMYKNANRLLYTVNQLMDFRKKESGHLKLKAAEGNIVKFVNEIFIAFNELARSRHINFRFECGVENHQLWYDRDLLEKVLFNLLSNAFKNTPDGGNITVALSLAGLDELKREFGHNAGQLPVAQDFAIITVTDNGSGIPETELEKIFDPFYQVHQKGIPQPFGTGIGLNLSRGVVELHHGAIWAANIQGAGAVFRVVLPSGKAHLKENELETDFRNSEDSSHYRISYMQEPEQQVAWEPSGEKADQSVLIVEDNLDVRHYIKSHLGKYYTIYEAGNGQEAIDKAVEHLPDLVVSDIMMPVMDGIELCRLLKNDLRTGHIPVILLTARVTVMQVQEGFEIGADNYITKPFNASLLLVRIKNLIASREKLRELFGQKTSFAFPELPTSSVDSRFMETVYKYINEHLTDPEMNMDSFCKEIGMSRSNFYRKIKTLSDLNPNELIRNTRLQFAVKHLRETELSISEIAYAVGFSSPSYFTKTFRTFFGMSPTEMKEKGM